MADRLYRGVSRRCHIVESRLILHEYQYLDEISKRVQHNDFQDRKIANNDPAVLQFTISTAELDYYIDQEARSTTSNQSHDIDETNIHMASSPTSIEDYDDFEVDHNDEMITNPSPSMSLSIGRSSPIPHNNDQDIYLSHGSTSADEDNHISHKAYVKYNQMTTSRQDSPGDINKPVSSYDEAVTSSDTTVIDGLTSVGANCSEYSSPSADSCGTNCSNPDDCIVSGGGIDMDYQIARLFDISHLVKGALLKGFLSYILYDRSFISMPLQQLIAYRSSLVLTLQSHQQSGKTGREYHSIAKRLRQLDNWMQVIDMIDAAISSLDDNMMLDEVQYICGPSSCSPKELYRLSFSNPGKCSCYKAMKSLKDGECVDKSLDNSSGMKYSREMSRHSNMYDEIWENNQILQQDKNISNKCSRRLLRHMITDVSQCDETAPKKYLGRKIYVRLNIRFFQQSQQHLSSEFLSIFRPVGGAANKLPKRGYCVDMKVQKYDYEDIWSRYGLQCRDNSEKRTDGSFSCWFVSTKAISKLK